MAVGDAAIPAYLVVDTSGSMAGGKIKAVNRAINDLLNYIHSDPQVSNLIYLSIITFSSGARVALPLSRGESIDPSLSISASGTTDLGAALKRLSNSIQNDIPQLKNEGLRVYRPLVFLFLDGSPTDDLKAGVEALGQVSFRPTITVFGIDDADPSIIRRLASRHELAYISGEHADPGQVASSK